MGEELNGDLREQGRAVWETKLRSVQGCPFEVTPQKKKLNNAITLCGSLCTCTPLRVGLFISLFWHISSEKTQADKQKVHGNLATVVLYRVLNNKHVWFSSKKAQLSSTLTAFHSIFFNSKSLLGLCGIRIEIKDCG